MTDQGFPIIEKPVSATCYDFGVMHGESYRTGIQELVAIRRSLMREKNPGLDSARIAELALAQWEATELCDSQLTRELAGICVGADVTREEIVILNNYTDFRDIEVPDQGCSTVYVKREGDPLAGQTWDMHGSAKDYVCCLHLPAEGGQAETILFSIVGCVGMMGYTGDGRMLGVNNINTTGARAGVIWPVLVRRVLAQTTHQAMVDELTSAEVTSGHAYLLASHDSAEMWEVMPGLSERVDFLDGGQSGHLFHTNHCLGTEVLANEQQTSLTSTTHIRFGLLEKKIAAVGSMRDVYDLLNDHENYPKSICSNFQTSSQDPSITCGGAAGNLESGEVKMWRGDAKYDDNFVCHSFELTERIDAHAE